MPRLSKLIEKLEDRLEPKVGPWYERHKKKLPLYAAAGLAGWYLYGMLLNSIRLGTASTFHKEGDTVIESIWVFNPFRNWFVLFTPFGLGATAVIALLVCLFTGTGYKWFSGYKATRDSRGFDILPDGTHGSSGFLTRKEMGEFLEVGSVSEVKGMMLGKYKRQEKDSDKYALYAAHRMVPGDNNNLLCIGAPGSGKGTQSERLISHFGLHHISTGEVLRDHIARGTELGKIADSYISKGQLIPDDLMIRVLEHVLDANPELVQKGVIFDGFPRTIDQAKALKEMLAKRGSRVHAVVGLEVEEDELVRRMLNRGKETGRADDNLDTIKNRLQVYHTQTCPLRDYYIGEGKYHAIDGNGSVDEIFGRIHDSLHQRVPELAEA